MIFLDLPTEILLKIILKLDLKSIINVIYTSKLFRKIILQNIIFKCVCGKKVNYYEFCNNINCKNLVCRKCRYKETSINICSLCSIHKYLPLCNYIDYTIFSNTPLPPEDDCL